MLYKVAAWTILAFGWCVMWALFALGVSYLLLIMLWDGWLRRPSPARPSLSLVKSGEVVKLLRN